MNTAIVAILVAITAMAGGGLLHFGMYWYNEGKKARRMEEIEKIIARIENHIDIHDGRTRSIELKLAALTRRANGESYGEEVT